MDLSSLRQAHPTFVYESYSFKIADGLLSIKFHFHISPNIDFFPTTQIPLGRENPKEIDNFVFHLGLIEMVSYWKAACSPTIEIKAGHLSSAQIDWWKDLFKNGLGEFFYVNKIDFTQSDFLTIKTSSKKHFGLSHVETSHDLVLVGGGKDSALTLELLSPEHGLFVNPTQAALAVADVAKVKNKIIVNREIDPLLLRLNEQGYLNGHTPFSAYLSFLSLLVAYLYQFKNVIVSNENSAGEANLEYLGLKVNHQYSKSFEYEERFKEYSCKYLTTDVNYFSFLRPLNELQIAALFFQTDKYDLAFNSCNVSRNKYWCGNCAKCAFVYLIASALIDKSRKNKIFGDKDFFTNENIQTFISQLKGEGEHKPLDCVGTEEESRLAAELIDKSDNESVKERILNDWGVDYFLPDRYKEILASKMKGLKL